MSEAVKELFFKVADEEGWLRGRDNLAKSEESKRVAKNFLLLGVPVEKVSKATGLPIDIVESLV